MTTKKTKDLIQAAWDSCVWIDFFQQAEGAYPYLRSMAELAEQGGMTIVTSSIVLAEVYRIENNQPPEENLERIRLYLMSKHIRMEAAHGEICERAQDIQALSVERNCKVKPMDAIHLATAAYANVPSFLTMEGNPKCRSADRQKNLLRMDGLVSCQDGTQLEITTPLKWGVAKGILQLSFP